MAAPKDSRSAVGLAIGIGLVALGSWWFLRDSGLVPTAVFDSINRISWPIAIIVLGVTLIYLARRAHTPAPGSRLYRSRDDRWIAGVLGGLAPYLGVDAIVLRVAFIVLSVVGLGGPLILAYIIGAVLVPEEPFVPPQVVGQ